MQTGHNNPAGTACGKTALTVLFAAALALRLVASPPPASAREGLVVKDAEIKPYRDAVRGFENACGCALKELAPSDGGLLAKVEAARPAFVFAVGTQAFRKVRAVRDVPVIYAMVMPSETSFSADNVSGVSMDVSPEAYLDAMAALFPAAKRIGVISDPEHTGPFVEKAAALARARGLALVVKTISAPRQAPALLDELRGRIDVLWMLPEPTLVNAETTEYLMLFSFQNNVPVFSFARKYVERGAVAALTIDPYDLGVQAGELARRLARGGAGPVRDYAKNPRLVVNPKVAAKLGVRISGEAIGNAERLE